MDHFFHLDDLNRQRASKGKLYLEFLRMPATSAGVYVLPKGGTDPQKPHHEDELYYVVRGRARMQIIGHVAGHDALGIGLLHAARVTGGVKYEFARLLDLLQTGRRDHVRQL